MSDTLGLSESLVLTTKKFLSSSCRRDLWHDCTVIYGFLMDEQGYSRSTARLYTRRYLRASVGKGEIEISASGRSWRWLADR